MTFIVHIFLARSDGEVNKRIEQTLIKISMLLILDIEQFSNDD